MIQEDIMKTKQTFVATLGIETEDGAFVAHYSEEGLARLDFPVAKAKITSTLCNAQVKRWHNLTTSAVHQALRGRQIKNLPPIDLRSGTEFQRKVWATLQRIPAGSTATYTQCAESVGKPKAARATGSACGKNPIPLLIPCHRVLAAGGKLGGFSGGLHWKQKLLAREKSTMI
jgi:O-6-methylguanine DNA methyltransferase